MGDHVGDFIRIDDDHKYTKEEPYMRLRAVVDVRRSIRKEKKFRRPMGEWLTASFKYGKLSTSCFMCGGCGTWTKVVDGDLKQVLESYPNDGVQL